LSELVVSGGDAAEVIEASEHALDEVSLLVGDGVVGYLALATPGGRNDGLGAVLAQGRSGIIGTVCDELGEGPEKPPFLPRRPSDAL
jgi:hypothetical protein